MHAFYWSSGIVFFNESLILTSGNGFLANYKTCAFIQNFFVLVDTIVQIKCKPIFKDKQNSCSVKPFCWIVKEIPASRSTFFRLVKIDFSSNLSLRLVYLDFGLIQIVCFYSEFFLLLLESIIEIRC